MQKLEITMLGPSGVGKTSLLAVMWDQFEKVQGRDKLQMIPDSTSTAKLEARLKDLKTICDGLKPVGGLEGTTNPASYILALGQKGKEPSLNLYFQDYPGGWIESLNSETEISAVQKFIKESTVVLIAIDTPALMEPFINGRSQGRWHNDKNKPSIILNLFKKAYTNLDSPRLVILAPIKCEAYLHYQPRGPECLLSRVKEGYKGLLNFLGADVFLEKVAVVVTPVQTTGNIEFSYVEVKDEPTFRFAKNQSRAPFSPEDSEQPLRYLLSFLLKRHLEARQWPFFNFLRDLFELDKEFKEAVEEFSNNYEANEKRGFAILQGKKLLK